VNPWAATLREYFPGGKFLNSYMPWALLWTTTGDPAAGVMITLALEIAAPEGSVTCPRRTPKEVCADKTNAENKNKSPMKKRTNLSTLISLFPDS
jgi:hypothetical protein